MSGQSNKSIKEHINQSIDISNGDKNKNLSVLKLFANYPNSSRSQQTLFERNYNKHSELNKP